MHIRESSQMELEIENEYGKQFMQTFLVFLDFCWRRQNI